ncbi:MAG: CBS domain-containing protein [Nitrososphaerales archaeon]
MVLKRMIPLLYDSLTPLRNRSVRQFMEAPLVVDANSSISNIIGVLDEAKGYEAFIPLSNKIASINIRDILGARHIVSAKPSVIGKIVPSLSYDSNLGYAARIMSYYRLRALPIVENNEIVGQITAKSVVRGIKDVAVGGVKASDIMTPKPIMVRAKDKAASAKGIIIRHRIDHLPVMEENRLVGMVTSMHMIKAMLPSERIGRRELGMDKLVRFGFPVIGIADRDVVISKPDDSLQSVTSLIADTNSTYSLVKVWEEVQGIITYRDIVALLEEKVEEDIPAFIVGLPDDPFDAELAKSKFTNLIKLLRKVSPEIEEARCYMKIRDMQGERRRYEVDINIITPYRRHTYTNIGWDLAKMFDQVSDGLKKKLAHRPSRKRKESVRYRTDHYISEE